MTETTSSKAAIKVPIPPGELLCGKYGVRRTHTICRK